jgi:cupin fold WbuC family metalloprotein
MENLTCRCCAGTLEVLLDLGAQPICSHFKAHAGEKDKTHPLALAQCTGCGQLQIQDPAPVALLRSPHSWVSYIEPEGHLDQLVEELCAQPNAGPHWRVGGVTYKDDSTLERLRKRGWQNLCSLDLVADLEITDGATDLAVIQEHLTRERARRIATTHGRFDVLLVRHILEHTLSPRGFLAALTELITPEGLIIFECPDSQQAFLHREYTVLWEEHLWYFTPELFTQFFGHFDLHLERVHIYPYAVENSLVAFVSPRAFSTGHRRPSPAMVAAELASMRRYAGGFSRQKIAWQEWIGQSTGRVAAFGAGHAMTSFINFFELKEQIAFVADDHPMKQGLFLPGNDRVVKPSSALHEGGIDYCLMGLSTESEIKVLARQTAAQNAGVRFVSIFASSSHAAPAVKMVTSAEHDVLKLDTSLPVWDDGSIDRLRAAVRQSSRLRTRFCAHASAIDRLHEMLICLHADGYVRPHRHLGKAESIHVVEGFADLILFTDDGRIDQVIPLGPRSSGRTWFVLLARPVFHTLVLRGEDFIFQESTLGPFQCEATEMARWAPEEKDLSGASVYKNRLLGEALTRVTTSKSLS